jgi:hypothetical protein
MHALLIDFRVVAWKRERMGFFRVLCLSFVTRLQIDFRQRGFLNRQGRRIQLATVAI